MKKLYVAKILEVDPYSSESPDHIVDAYLTLKLDDSLILKCFVPDWRTVFPYLPKPSKWGLGKTLINNLKQKKITMSFKFIDLKPIQLCKKHDVIIIQKYGEYTKICGKIIEKISHSEFDSLFVDCGIIVQVNCNKGSFSLNDFIETSGILNAYIVEIVDKPTRKEINNEK